MHDHDLLCDKSCRAQDNILSLACTLWRSSKVGKLCWTCHVTLGRKISTAITPPIQIHGLKNSLRSAVSNMPTTIANPKNSVECLFINPRPATTPNQTHSREFPVWMIRIRT